MKASTALIAIVVVYGGYRYAEERRKQRAKNSLPPAPAPRPLATASHKQMLTFPKIINVEPSTEPDDAITPNEETDAGE